MNTVPSLFELCHCMLYPIPALLELVLLLPRSYSFLPLTNPVFCLFSSPLAVTSCLRRLSLLPLWLSNSDSDLCLPLPCLSIPPSDQACTPIGQCRGCSPFCRSLALLPSYAARPPPPHTHTHPHSWIHYLLQPSQSDPNFGPFPKCTLW